MKAPFRNCMLAVTFCSATAAFGAKNLGDATADLVYTPLAPCRLIDTRGLGAPFAGGAYAPGERRSYLPAGACAIPASGVATILATVTTQNLTPNSGGYLAMLAPAAPVTTLADIFNVDSTWSASSVAVASGPAGQFDVFVNGANAHVIVDVLGYFRAPSSHAATSVGVNVAAGASTNGVTSGAVSATVAGGGTTGTSFFTGFTTFGCPGVNCGNRVTDHGGTVAGGIANVAGNENGTLGDAWAATVAGGFRNRAQADFAFVGGGYQNDASGINSTVGGGFDNNASGVYSVVGGGNANTASGGYSVVLGGLNNVASGMYSIAAGRNARTQTSGGGTHTGAFVWADGSTPLFHSTASNEFSARATGGARFVTAIDVAGAPTAGVRAAPGAGSWSSLSDVNAKTDFRRVDSREVLARVAALPMATWRYKAQDGGIRHIGPMAQDFRAAFGVGEDETTISTVDADGVALAAIQGLERLMREKDDRIRKLEADVAQMRADLETLRR